MKKFMAWLKDFMQLEIMMPMWVAMLLALPAIASIVFSVVKVMM